VFSIVPLARKPFRAGPEIYAPKHGRLPGSFFNHRNRPEACPGQPGSSQQGLKNPDYYYYYFYYYDFDYYYYYSVILLLLSSRNASEYTPTDVFALTIPKSPIRYCIRLGH
jgi:hypothetical protein